MKIFGFIPARMASSRLPGKPLRLISGRPMLEHVYERSKLFKKWDKLIVATCDQKISNFCKSKNYDYIMTSKKHKGCLDRVFEAVKKSCKNIKENDVVVCIQGDEPMLHPNMINAVVNKLFSKNKAKATILGMQIVTNKQFQNKNVLKIVNDSKDEVLYCSRSPIPYVRKFDKNYDIKRIFGIFAFRHSFLKKYFKTKPSPLEILEKCDQNRICENSRGMYVAPYKFIKSYAVDTIQDLKLVNKLISQDSIFSKY
jgi:3-deoxy-manno-octulosonate cytidylyltransferase (CMP-KDO synthetase)